MITSKVFALALLICFPLALAQSKLATTIEINDAGYHRTIGVDCTLDCARPATIYESNEIRIEAELLSETSTEVYAHYTVSCKNADGQYQVLTHPVVCAAYGDTATIKFGQETAGTELVTFHMTVVASQA